MYTPTIESVHCSYIKYSSVDSIGTYNKRKYDLVYSHKNLPGVEYPFKYRKLNVLLPEELVEKNKYQLFMKKLIKKLNITFYKYFIVKKKSTSNAYYLVIYYTDRKLKTVNNKSKVTKYINKKKKKYVRKEHYDKAINKENYLIIKAGKTLLEVDENGNFRKSKNKSFGYSRSSKRKIDDYYKYTAKLEKTIVKLLNEFSRQYTFNRLFLTKEEFKRNNFKHSVKFKVSKEIDNKGNWAVLYKSERKKLNEYFKDMNRHLFKKRIKTYKSFNSVLLKYDSLETNEVFIL